MRRFAARTDALVIFTNLQSPRSSVLDDFRRRPAFPSSSWTRPSSAPIPAVAIDRAAGYREAVRHLARRGPAR